MMRWILDCLEVARQSVSLQIRTTIVRLLALGCLLAPAAFVALAHRAAPEMTGESFFGVVAYMVLLQFGLPATVLYLGVTVMHGDLQDRTATYLFVRPVHRSSLLVGKCLAVTVLCWCGAALALCAFWLGLDSAGLAWRLGAGPGSELLWAFVLAAGMVAAAYTCVVACLSAAVKRPLVIGAVFVVGWEFMVALSSPTAGMRAVSVLDPVRSWLVRSLQPGGELAELLSAGAVLTPDGDAGLGSPLWSLGRFMALALLLGLWLYTRREYDARASE